MTVTRNRLPWGQFIQGDCACTTHAPCLVHFNDLDWRGRAAALTSAGIQLSTGR